MTLNYNGAKSKSLQDVEGLNKRGLCQCNTTLEKGVQKYGALGYLCKCCADEIDQYLAELGYKNHKAIPAGVTRRDLQVMRYWHRVVDNTLTLEQAYALADKDLENANKP